MKTIKSSLETKRNYKKISKRKKFTFEIFLKIIDSLKIVLKLSNICYNRWKNRKVIQNLIIFKKKF